MVLLVDCVVQLYGSRFTILEDFNFTVLYPMYTFNPKSCHHFALKPRIPAFKKCMSCISENLLQTWTSWRNCRPPRWDALGNCLASHTESKHHAVRDRFRQAIRPYNDILTRWRNPTVKLKLFGRVARSAGLAKTILWGTVEGGRRRVPQKKSWENNISEWTGLKFVIP